jgi:hypothetical protein
MGEDSASIHALLRQWSPMGSWWGGEGGGGGGGGPKTPGKNLQKKMTTCECPPYSCPNHTHDPKRELADRILRAARARGGKAGG